MKLIKLLVTLSLVNALIVIGIAHYMSINQVPAPSPTTRSSPTPSVLPTSTPSSTPEVTSKPSPSVSVNVTKSSMAPKPVGCVITIDGVSYEITKLRTTHTGGDVFKCGEDMSVLFWKKHNQEILNIMQQYKI